MEQETQTTEKLIDFLYRDLSRIDSFYAQLFSGALREVQTSSEAASTHETEIGAGIAVVSGSHSRGQSYFDKIVKSSDPHDHRILDLLSVLRSFPIEQSKPTRQTFGQIFLLQGTITIRDYQTIKQALPLIADNPHFTQADGEKKQTKAERKQQRDALKKVLELVPMGLELEVMTNEGETFIGTLKPEFLSEKPEELLRIYGNTMPGNWYITGIVDSLYPSTFKPARSELRKSLDDYSRIIKLMFNQDLKGYSISPFLIFRELNL